ncbi:MAG: choice-of-anchor L domain-containing protein [Verrucomicrobiota bacterium]
MKRLLLFAGLLGSCVVAHSEDLQIISIGQQGLNPAGMAALLTGRGVVVTNVQYTGAGAASGIFCSGEDIVGFETGLLLTSGNAAGVVGPNNNSGAGAANNVPGDTDLDGLIPGFETHDASVLEFDFIPQGTTVQFQYVFGSEEYNDFVNSPFNDVFGFFVNGQNYALLPGSTTPVSINNVNNGYSSGVATGPCQNCQFYIDNVEAATARNTQLDGLTTVLTMIAPVNPGQLNHMKIAIADAGDSVLDSAVFIQAGSLSSGTVSSNLVTRNAQFWFEHAYPTSTNCANLRDAMQASLVYGCNSIGVDLGFISLPQYYDNNDNVRDVEDVTIEALGFYYRKQRRTGETGGTQNAGSLSSKLCRERKQLAVELIAALANVNLLGANPALLPYNNGVVITNFPADLIKAAQVTAAGDNIENIVIMTSLLKKFNSSAITNALPGEFTECSPQDKKSLQTKSRDPTTKSNCPGQNDTCSAAAAVVFPNDQTNVLANAKFNASADLSKYTDDIVSPTCGGGGADAVWKVTPTVGRSGRRFTASTFGSNFDTLLSVQIGPCDALSEVACNDNAPNSVQSQVSFTTDGTNTYYIVVEGSNGTVGKLKLKVTSP